MHRPVIADLIRNPEGRQGDTGEQANTNQYPSPLMGEESKVRVTPTHVTDCTRTRKRKPTPKISHTHNPTKKRVCYTINVDVGTINTEPNQKTKILRLIAPLMLLNMPTIVTTEEEYICQSTSISYDNHTIKLISMAALRKQNKYEQSTKLKQNNTTTRHDIHRRKQPVSRPETTNRQT